MAPLFAYTADLRGDVSPDVTHLFGAKAGFFCRLARTLMLSWEIKTRQWAVGLANL